MALVALSFRLVYFLLLNSPGIPHNLDFRFETLLPRFWPPTSLQPAETGSFSLKPSHSFEDSLLYPLIQHCSSTVPVFHAPKAIPSTLSTCAIDSSNQAFLGGSQLSLPGYLGLVTRSFTVRLKFPFLRSGTSPSFSAIRHPLAQPNRVYPTVNTPTSRAVSIPPVKFTPFAHKIRKSHLGLECSFPTIHLVSRTPTVILGLCSSVSFQASLSPDETSSRSLRIRIFVIGPPTSFFSVSSALGRT